MRTLKIVDRKEMNRTQVEKKWSGANGVKLAYTADAQTMQQAGYDTKFIKSLCAGITCEVGCGPGRLAHMFNRNEYIGIDINAQAIKQARINSPRHKFLTINWDDCYPIADTYLFHTVLFHVPDSELDAIFDRINGRLVISESMIHWIRKFGQGFNFHRDPQAYINLAQEHGFKFVNLHHAPITTHPYFTNYLVMEK